MKLIQLVSLALVLTLLGSGCTSKLLININAIADKNLVTNGKKYVFTSDMDGVDENDLYFKEFSGIFDVVLQRNGYVKASKMEQADLVLKLKYAVSDGVTGVHTYRTPIYQHTFSETYAVTELTTNPKTGAVTGQRYKTIFIPSRVQYIGSRLETYSYTLYNRVAWITAVRSNTAQQDEKTATLLWQTQISNVSESNDLRQAMPYFAFAASNFLGKSSGQQQIIELDLEDAGVAALRATQNIKR